MKALYEKIKPLYDKYRDIISYIFFGVVTTVVNAIAYYVCHRLLHIPNLPSTFIAWFIAVLTAFFTNKIFVFRSHDWSPKVAWSECLKFFSCRLGSEVVELVLMWWTVDMLHWNDMAMKLIVNFIVIVLNYVASKVLVFRKSEN